MENSSLCERKFSLIKELSTAIATMDDINFIANLLLDLATNYTKAEKGSLMLLNEKGELYILAARDVDIRFIRNYRGKSGEGIAGTVLKNALPVMVEDIEKDPRFRDKKRDRYKTRSFISCPMMSRKKILGVLNINDKKDNTPFTEDEFELVKVIADQAAIFLDNAFLMKELKMKAGELEEVNRKLIESDVSKTEFLTRISHDVRTPLNSIKGSIYYLQQTDTLGKEQQKEFFSIISDETNNLISVVENLLAFLRLEDEMKALNKTVLDIAGLLRETVQSKVLLNRLAKKNLRIELDIGDNLTDIVGDRIKIVQFFINLLEGLSHYLQDGDAILISARESDYLEIHLDLPRKMPETVFTYLLNAKKIYDTGHPEEIVQLYLARKIAEVHYWDIEMANSGSRCSLRLKIFTNANMKMETAINLSMDMFAEHISDLLNVDICSIMLTDNLTGELTIKSARGLSDDIVRRTRIRPGDKIAGWVALEGKPLLIDDIENDSRFGKKSISQYSTKSLISLPLKLRDRVVGVLNLNNKKNAEEFTPVDFQIASVISERVSYFIDKLTSGEYSESEFKRFLDSFSGLLRAEKKSHKKQVKLTYLITHILDELGASEENRKIAPYISIVYDFGLALVDDGILKKKKNLSPSEQHCVRFHPTNSVFLLEGLEFSDVIKKAILHHHERFDGTGYPDGLKGEEIPFLARVIAVADSFSAMTTERPYRNKLSRDRALAEIREGAGSRYDPAVTEALERALRKEMSPAQ